MNISVKELSRKTKDNQIKPRAELDDLESYTMETAAVGALLQIADDVREMRDIMRDFYVNGDTIKRKPKK